MKKWLLFRKIPVMRTVFVLFGLFIATIGTGMAQVCGCTDPVAKNYNDEATVKMAVANTLPLQLRPRC